MNLMAQLIAGLLVLFLLYLLWRIARELWRSRDRLFPFIRFALTAAFLALVCYVLYQNFDVGNLLKGLLWLLLGVFLLSALLATIERFEQNQKRKK